MLRSNPSSLVFSRRDRCSERGNSAAFQLQTQQDSVRAFTEKVCNLPCARECEQVFVGTFALFAAHLLLYPKLLGIEVRRGWNAPAHCLEACLDQIGWRRL